MIIGEIDNFGLINYRTEFSGKVSCILCAYLKRYNSSYVTKYGCPDLIIKLLNILVGQH